jgi:hypothetical protein
MSAGIPAGLCPGYRARALAALSPVIAAAAAERAAARERAERLATPEAWAGLHLAERRLALLKQSRLWLAAGAGESAGADQRQAA